MRKGRTLIVVDDIVGKQLGRLHIDAYAGSKYEQTKVGEKMRHYYRCTCECGTTKVK